eukprot:6838523-Alexandrium_andersonii.AAC.1
MPFGNRGGEAVSPARTVPARGHKHRVAPRAAAARCPWLRPSAPCASGSQPRQVEREHRRAD